MAKQTLQDKVDAIPEDVKQELVLSALNGGSIIGMSRKYKLPWRVVQFCLWQNETPVWRGTKQKITRRLRLLRTEKSSAKHDRDSLINELEEQINYLYFAARQLQTKLDRVKAVVNHHY